MVVHYPDTKHKDGTDRHPLSYLYIHYCKKCSGRGEICWYGVTNSEELESYSEVCDVCEGWGSHTDGREESSECIFQTVVTLITSLEKT